MRIQQGGKTTGEMMEGIDGQSHKQAVVNKMGEATSKIMGMGQEHGESHSTNLKLGIWT